MKPIEVMSNCRKVAVPALIGFTVAAPTIAVIAGDIPAAGLLLLTGAAAVLLTRLDDIRKLKLGSLEAELERKIDEARATIEQLRHLARVIAEPALSAIAMQGQWRRELSFSYRYEMQQRIDNALEQFGLSVKERQEIAHVWSILVARGLAFRAVGDLKNGHPEHAERIEQLFPKDGGRPAPPSDVRQFLEENRLLDDERARHLTDYEHFWKTGEVLHPEDWPVGFHP